MLEILGNYHFVCLKCRRSIKVWKGQRVWASQTIPCVVCSDEMIGVGKQFTTPRKKDDAAWKKLEWMIANGWRGYGWPTQPKMNLRAVQNSLALETQRKQQAARESKANAALLERRRAAKANLSISKHARKQQKAEWKRQEEYQLRVLTEAQNSQNLSK